MKVAFPVGKETGTEQPVAEHFGTSPNFLVLWMGGKAKASIKNTSTHFGGSKMPVELLAEKGVGTIVCRSIGQNAVRMCKMHSIDVYFAPEGASVEEAFRLLLEGKLRKAVEGDGCKEHLH